jgi:hypothetical protein
MFNKFLSMIQCVYSCIVLVDVFPEEPENGDPSGEGAKIDDFIIRKRNKAGFYNA